MAPAPRNAPRRPSTSSSSKRRLLIAGGVVLAAVLVYVLYRRTRSSSSLDTSGTPGPDRTGSASNLGPSGGGASAGVGQLPATLVSQPDQLQTQVQQTDTTNGESPTSISTPNQPYYNPALPVPTLPPNAPIPGTSSHPQDTGGGGAPILNTPPGSNAHQPGFQIE